MKKAKYTPQELLEIRFQTGIKAARDYVTALNREIELAENREIIGSRSRTESLRGIFGVMIDPKELHTLTSAMMQCTVGENSK